MGDEVVRPIAIGIIRILTDIFNLAEQFGIYFIAKENDLTEEVQQRFFFILFAVGGASTFEPCFCHPITKVLFAVMIEVGEFVCYLTVLPRTTNLLIVAGVFFSIEVLFYLINIILLVKEKMESWRQCAVESCLVPVRLLVYGALYEIQILFLFLDPNSAFRDEFYEILMILNIFFGIISVHKMIGIGLHLKAMLSKSEDLHSEFSDDSVYLVWQILILLLNVIVGIILMIAGVVFAAQALTNPGQLKTYDFVIYIFIIISYGSGLLGLVIGCCTILPLCCFGVVAFSAAKLKELLS